MFRGGPQVSFKFGSVRRNQGENAPSKLLDYVELRQKKGHTPPSQVNATFLPMPRTCCADYNKRQGHLVLDG